MRGPAEIVERLDEVERLKRAFRDQAGNMDGEYLNRRLQELHEEQIALEDQFDAMLSDMWESGQTEELSA